ncbi:MAG: HAD-IA family hydrolase [Bdellovibrionota bacterium]
MTKPLKGIVFDLDGTLIDSLAVTIDAFNHGITTHGGRKHTPKEILAHFGPGEGQIFAKILGPEKAASAYEASRKYTDDHKNKMPLHPGIGELLEQLKSSGVPISIFTGRSWETTELILKHHRLLDRFVTVVANDHVSMAKPSPEGLYLCLERMKLKPDEILFIGDSPSDMIAARAAKSRGVGALWDLLATKKSLEIYQPDHYAERPEEIWEIWKRIR